MLCINKNEVINLSIRLIINLEIEKRKVKKNMTLNLQM